MEYGVEYERAFLAIAQRMNFPLQQSPLQAVTGWQDIIDQIREGYPSIQPELDYDLTRSREPIETFLLAEELNRFSEHDWFKQRIAELDEEFRMASVEVAHWWKADQGFRWWERRVLRYGSATYADFINAHFGAYVGFVVQVKG